MDTRDSKLIANLINTNIKNCSLESGCCLSISLVGNTSGDIWGVDPYNQTSFYGNTTDPKIHEKITKWSSYWDESRNERGDLITGTRD